MTYDEIEKRIEEIKNELESIDALKKDAVEAMIEVIANVKDAASNCDMDLAKEGTLDILNDAFFDHENPLREELEQLETAQSMLEDGSLRRDYYASVL